MIESCFENMGIGKYRDGLSYFSTHLSVTNGNGCCLKIVKTVLKADQLVITSSV